MRRAFTTITVEVQIELQALDDSIEALVGQLDEMCSHGLIEGAHIYVEPEHYHFSALSGPMQTQTIQ